MAAPASAPWTWTARDDATSGRLQTLTDWINYLRAPDACILRASTTQNIPNASFTAVTFDVEDLDRGGVGSGLHAPANPTRVTVATSGWYDVGGVVPFASVAAAADRALQALVNGVTAYRLFEAGAAASSGSGPSGSRPIFLNAGDYVELFVYQASGAALSTAVSAAGPAFNVFWRST